MYKFVLVTGGANGIGLAVTQKLMESGFKVFCADLEMYKGEQNQNIIPLVMDVTCNLSIANAVEQIKGHTDTLLAIVNSAGIFTMGSVAEIDEKKLNKIIDVNVMGMYRVNKACLPLLKGNYSRIINISSEVAQYSSAPFNGPYVISKFAVEAYSDALRRELMLLDIPVIKIRAGALKTNMLAGVSGNFDELLGSTKYFKKELSKMNDMMSRELNKTTDPRLVGELVNKIINAKKPKILYRIVNSKQLKFMGAMPEKIQDKLYKKVIKGRNK